MNVGFSLALAGESSRPSPDFNHRKKQNESHSEISIRSDLEASNVQQNISQLSEEFEMAAAENTLRSNKQFSVHYGGDTSNGSKTQQQMDDFHVNQEQSSDYHIFKSRLGQAGLTHTYKSGKRQKSEVQDSNPSFAVHTVDRQSRPRTAANR